MNNYEYDGFPQEPRQPEHTSAPVQNEQNAAPQQNAYSAPYQQYPSGNSGSYHGGGAGRKESPFADSPYVMNHQPHYQNPQQSYQYPPQYEPQKPQKVRKVSGGVWKKIVAAVLAVALIAGSCGITAAIVNERWETRTSKMEDSFTRQIDKLQKQVDSMGSKQAVSGAGVAAGEAMMPSQVYASNVDSVVAITASVQNAYAQGTSAGSGFILTEDGYVITNCHVVEGATSITVITHDGTEYPASLEGADATNDVAVLKVEAAGLPAVTMGSSDALSIGDMVVAIGNPLGTLSSTQTVGYVSGKDRDVSTDGSLISMIQTDAAINSGNSGGPLFNMRGEVVGITTAKYSGTSTSGATIEGIGFAIPIDDVMGIIGDLIDYGYVTGAYMGITVSNTDEESASMFGLPTGAYVMSVETDGSADRAGIQPKDIIIDLGGYKVTGITSLTRALRNFKAGDTTTVTLIRSGAEMELEITLDEKPQNLNQPETVPEGSGTMPSEGNPNDWYEYFRRYFGE